MEHIKTRTWQFVRVFILLVLVEFMIHEISVKRDYALLKDEDTHAEALAVKRLVKGCQKQKDLQWLPSYFAERIFGKCRSLFGAPLENAKLSNTDLRSTELSSANLKNAELKNTDFRGANLIRANLTRTNLTRANFKDSYLSEANLTAAILNDANLSNAYLYGAKLSSTKLIGADLSRAILNSTSLYDADLSRTNLTNANFRGAILSRTKLSNAILLNSNFRETKKLNYAQVLGKKYPLICNSSFPQNIKILQNRDCDDIATALHDRYPKLFSSLDEAETYVKENRNKKK
ncbi:pentapeptide repeat-containing protein [Acaryochloris marina NIES-2412]|uniref:pentapeptide repeat-containing protein n=1 Tax=Acaryochloris marina TaxID=155978 RepID=UPI004059425C